MLSSSLVLQPRSHCLFRILLLENLPAPPECQKWIKISSSDPTFLFHSISLVHLFQKPWPLLPFNNNTHTTCQAFYSHIFNLYNFFVA